VAVLDARGSTRKRLSIFIAGRDGYLRALRCRDRRDGLRCRERWAYRAGAAVTSAPLVAETRVLVASYDNVVYALSRQKGHLRWQARASHRLGLSPVPLEGRIVVAPQTAGGLQAFRLEDGAASGQLALGPRQELAAAPASSEGRLALLVARPTDAGASSSAPATHELLLIRAREQSDEEVEAERAARKSAR
jgi:outer membrane protein assembly factor BamB